ncbi:MAG: serine/threonine protein kinase [Burkholderiales bacterium]|nr:serine/threonine protein kinase [Burkholderiales bacterium]
MSATAPAPYERLTPERVLCALESAGLACDGRLLALNSFENRVYLAGLEDGASIVAKFYRPGRWSDAQIQEEHAFVQELAEREIPAVPPLELRGRTLNEFAGFRFAAFPRCGGRAPELEDREVLRWIGRFLGRIHAAGAARSYSARPALGIEHFGTEPRDWLLASGFIAPELRAAWQAAAGLALEGVKRCYERAGPLASLRLHGDCHAGNLLWIEDGPMRGPHFVDFDDSRSGPAVQDLWMLLPAERDAMATSLGELLAGYAAFRDFDLRELHLVEALRTLRLVHYSAWIARRWEDPAFPAAFPWFGTPRYWQDRILELKEQIALMDEAPVQPVRA